MCLRNARALVAVQLNRKKGGRGALVLALFLSRGAGVQGDLVHKPSTPHLEQKCLAVVHGGMHAHWRAEVLKC